MIKIDSQKLNFNKKLEIILNRRRKLDNSNTKIVSNHFNYQIKSQSINEYFQSCIITKNFIKSLGDNHLVIDYDNVVDKRKSLEEIIKLEKFLNVKINSDLVKRLN